jgi:hypothetical protein
MRRIHINTTKIMQTTLLTEIPRNKMIKATMTPKAAAVMLATWSPKLRLHMKGIVSVK